MEIVFLLTGNYLHISFCVSLTCVLVIFVLFENADKTWC